MEGKGTDSSSGNSKNSIASELRGSLNSTRKSCSIESVGGWNPDQNSTSWSLDFDGLPQLCMPGEFENLFDGMEEERGLVRIKEREKGSLNKCERDIEG